MLRAWSLLPFIKTWSNFTPCLRRSGVFLSGAGWVGITVYCLERGRWPRSGPNPCWRIGIRTTARFGWVDAADIAECVANLVLNPDIEKHIGKHYQLVRCVAGHPFLEGAQFTN